MKQISPLELNESAFRIIGKEWMLITAGGRDGFNTMTASWGALGELWSRPAAFCFIRPHRHTFGFMERNSYFTLSFFAEQERDALTLLGSKSGRDGDKVKEAGLTPVFGDSYTWFEEARLVLQCRKLYYQDLQPDNFVELSIKQECYPQRDYHRMYVGEVMQVLAA